MHSEAVRQGVEGVRNLYLPKFDEPALREIWGQATRRLQENRRVFRGAIGFLSAAAPMAWAGFGVSDKVDRLAQYLHPWHAAKAQVVLDLPLGFTPSVSTALAVTLGFAATATLLTSHIRGIRTDHRADMSRQLDDEGAPDFKGPRDWAVSRYARRIVRETAKAARRRIKEAAKNKRQQALEA